MVRIKENGNSPTFKEEDVSVADVLQNTELFVIVGLLLCPSWNPTKLIH